jgi:hypothetical protein
VKNPSFPLQNGGRKLKNGCIILQNGAVILLFGGGIRPIGREILHIGDGILKNPRGILSWEASKLPSQSVRRLSPPETTNAPGPAGPPVTHHDFATVGIAWAGRVVYQHEHAPRRRRCAARFRRFTRAGDQQSTRIVGLKTQI